VTVLDTSAVLDHLLGSGVSSEVEALLAQGGPAAAPDLVVFEVLAVLRRAVARKELAERRAQSAVADLGDMALTLFPSMPLRTRAWELRRNLTAADALFVALAEALDEPLATKDGGLATAAERPAAVDVITLGA
jgi:predicted nucleic acid-binding protein